MGTFIDIQGQTFGELTATKYIGNSKWECKCSCGELCEKDAWKLTHGKTKTCGNKDKHRDNLVGKKFGNFTVKKYANHGLWECECNCGAIVNRNTKDLLSGKAVQCRKCFLLNKKIETQKSLIGKRIGFITVIKPCDDYIYKNGVGSSRMLCQCICGKYFKVFTTKLKTNSIKSCGCKNDKSGKIKNDLSGKTFGKLSVIERCFPKNANGHVMYLCKCSCGNETVVSFSNLISGSITSCGCGRFGPHIEKVRGEPGEKIGMVTLIERLDSKHNGCYEWKCICDCGKEFIKTRHQLIQSEYASCGCITSSLGEKRISDILNKYKQNFIYNKMPQDVPAFNILKLYKARFDFLIYENEKIKLIIEYDGPQHFAPVKKWSSDGIEYARNVMIDNIKNEQCKANGIPLLRIKYTQYKNVEQILNFAIKNPNYFLTSLNPSMTNDEYYNDRVPADKINEYVEQIKEKHKTIVDHNGNEFFSIADMCRFWGIKPKTYKGRINKLHVSLKDALTMPVGAYRKKSNKIKNGE